MFQHTFSKRVGNDLKTSYDVSIKIQVNTAFDFLKAKNLNWQQLKLNYMKREDTILTREEDEDTSILCAAVVYQTLNCTALYYHGIIKTSCEINKISYF